MKTKNLMVVGENYILINKQAKIFSFIDNENKADCKQKQFILLRVK